MALAAIHGLSRTAGLSWSLVRSPIDVERKWHVWLITRPFCNNPQRGFINTLSSFGIKLSCLRLLGLMLLNTAIYFRLPLKALKVSEFSMHTSTKWWFNCQFPSLIAITPRTQIGSKVASFDLDSYSKERKSSNTQSWLILWITITSQQSEQNLRKDL